MDKEKNIPPKTAYTVSAGFKCLELFYKKNVDLYLCYCGMEDCSKGHSFGPAKREDYLIHYIISGKGTYHVGEKTYELKKGDFFLICPKQTTFYRADEEDPWSYLWVGFNGVKAPAYVEYLHLDERDKLVGSCDSTQMLIRFVTQMLEAKALTYANELKREGLLYQFLAELSRAGERFEDTTALEQGEYPYQIYVEYVLRYIGKHYAEDIRVGELADQMGLNRSYLSSCFKQMMGESLKDYLIRFRMERAERLLIETNERVQTIAGRVGYEDALAFSKAFKKKNSVSPSEYRRECLQDRERLQIENRF